MHTFRTYVPLAILVAMAAIACLPEGQAMLSEADKAAMKNTADEALAMFAAPTKDWAAFVKLLYTEDAVLLPPNAPAVKGHQAIMAFLQTFPAFSDFKQERQEIEGRGNVAYELQTYSATLALPDLPEFKDTGKVIWIWRKNADGSWQVWREMWNSDLAAPSGQE